ncbi:DUF5984 family protein [Micromonospora sp. NPDC051006]|uniref:DUF5984 family protein n=1 Tax=Micromonospora sp. NPDC051006 TaxID=3364283 RepID=UPI00379F627F
MIRFRFELYPPDEVSSWDGDQPTLHWFGLAEGWYRLEVGGQQLLRRTTSNIRIPSSTTTWPGSGRRVRRRAGGISYGCSPYSSARRWAGERRGCRGCGRSGGQCGDRRGRGGPGRRAVGPPSSRAAAWRRLCRETCSAAARAGHPGRAAGPGARPSTGYVGCRTGW